MNHNDPVRLLPGQSALEVGNFLATSMGFSPAHAAEVMSQLVNPQGPVDGPRELTPSEREAARMLGIPEAKYLKTVLEAERKASGKPIETKGRSK
jgi:hypothetical protein